MSGAYEDVTKKTVYPRGGSLSQGWRNSRRNSKVSNVLKAQLEAVNRRGFTETVKDLMRKHRRVG